MKTHSGFRSVSNFRYRLIKRYKHRAEKFLENAITDEEKRAWNEVVKWFDSILRENRYINKCGAICLSGKEDED